MDTHQSGSKTLLLVELALVTASKDKTRFLGTLGKLRNAEVPADEVRSVIQFVSEYEKIPLSELIPSGTSKTKAERCCGWEKDQ